MSETKVPAIPSTSSDKFSDAVKELIEVREGLRGDPLDQNVTLRQLQDAGVVSATVTSRGGSGGRPSVTLSPYGEPGYRDIPPAIQNLTVSGGYQQMFLEWDQPNYSNRSYVEVWRSDVDVLGGAIQIAQTPATVYSDPCGSGKTYYYWVRAVSTAGIIGPFNTVNGTVGSTAVDVDFMLETLNGELTSSQLHSDLGARIDLIDTDTLVNSVGARIASLRGDLEGDIAVVATDLVTVQQDIITRLDAIVLENATGDAALVLTEQTARIAADEVLAQQITAVAAVADGNTAALEVEYTARSNGDLAATNFALEAVSRVVDVEVALQFDYYTRASTNSAIAAATTTLSSTVNGHTASISTLTSTTNGLAAEYAVRLDVGGRVTGFGLYGGPTSSTFEVRADKFIISAPSSTSPADGVPFYHLTGPALIGGVTVPAGTYINTAFIADATIAEAKIGTLSADKITVGNIAANRMKANVIAATNISTDYILAERIDTKNLNVKDGNGNILLSSTKMPAAFNSTGYRWEFDPAVSYGGTQGLVGPWTGSGGVTVIDRDNYLELNYTTYTSGGPFLIGPNFTVNIIGKKHPVVRMRLKLYSGSAAGWQGVMSFTNSAGVTTAASTTADAPIGNNWVDIDWDLTDEGNWTNHSIQSLTFVLITPQWLAVNGSKPVFHIDYIAIGSHSTGMLIDSANVSTFIQAGVITNAFIGNTISSAEYDGSSHYDPNVSLYSDPGTVGWIIDKLGHAVFHNAYVRGDVRASSVTTNLLNTVSAHVTGTLTAADIEALNITVDTLNIAGEAVSVPGSVGLSSGVTITGSEFTIGTVTLDTGTVTAKVYMHAVLQVVPVSNYGNNQINLHLYESGTGVGVFGQSFMTGFGGQVTAVAVFDMPGNSGSKTYSVKVSQSYSTTPVMQTAGGVLYVSGTKR